MFEPIGKIIDKSLYWLFKFQGNDIQLLIWGGLIAAALVFFIEFLRRPHIGISVVDEGSHFNVYNSTLRKIKIEYKKSWFNSLLWRYPLSNLKIYFTFYSDNLTKIREFQGKPDRNPNVYEERDTTSTLMGINLVKNESETVPFILRSLNQQNLCGQNIDFWLPFEIWAVFLRQGFDEKKIKDGTYYIKVVVISDQAMGKDLFKIFLKDSTFSHEKLKIRLFSNL